MVAWLSPTYLSLTTSSLCSFRAIVLSSWTSYFLPNSAGLKVHPPVPWGDGRRDSVLCLTGNDWDVRHLVQDGISQWPLLKWRTDSSVLIHISCLCWHYSVFKSPSLACSVQLQVKSSCTSNSCCFTSTPGQTMTLLQLGQSPCKGSASLGQHRHLLLSISVNISLSVVCHVLHCNCSKG